MSIQEDLGGYSDSTIEDSDTEEQPLIPPIPEDSMPDDPLDDAREPDIENEGIAEAAAAPPVEIPPESPVKSGKRSHESDDDDDDDDVESRTVCPICMDKWTNSGNHRLVCLRCGHLFGYCCIVRWLEIGCFSGQRRCPQCNKKASKKDIRTLYVQNLQVLDTTECEKLKEELSAVKQEKIRLEVELARVNLNSRLHAEELKQALAKIKTLEEKIKTQQSIPSSQQASQQLRVTRMCLEHSLEISSAGGCRVLAYNQFLKQMCVSYNSSNNLFPGFCVRRIDMNEQKPVFARSIFLHSKAIRDLAFRPQSYDLLLSVSLDKTAKLLDLSSNGLINRFDVDSPVWSCCWDAGNLNRFFIGCQNGSILQFDSRQPSEPLNRFTVPGDLSAVTTLVSLPYCPERVLPQGGLLVSKLVSCWAYTVNSSDEYQAQQLSLEGPFTSLCYDSESTSVLISRRPNANNPNICHLLCQLEQEGTTLLCNPVHTFVGGTAQMQLSRPSFMKVANDTFVTAYVESDRRINAWSISSGQVAATVKVHEPVKDLCSFNIENKHLLAALSEKTLRLYCMV